MSEGSSEIIIKGSSVTLTYDDTQFPKEPGDPKLHKNDNRKITQIAIFDESDNEKFSASDNGGLRWTIKVTTK